jgi:DNA-binding winged helix-turn-helix (wHTH) protein
MTCGVGSNVFQQRPAGSIATALDAGEIGGILIAAQGEPIELACTLLHRFPVLKIPIAVLPQFSTEVLIDVPSRRFSSVLDHLVRAMPPCKSSTRELWIDPRGRDISLSGRRSSCSPLEFRLLNTFLRYPGMVFSREELVRRIRADDSPIDPQIVNVLVERIRKKIEVTPSAPRNLKTVRGLGYIYWNDGDIVIDGITRTRYVTWPCCPESRCNDSLTTR